MSLTLVTPPATEPIALSEVHDQCLILNAITDQDAQIEDVLIPAARDRAEQATDRAIMPQTWDLVLDRFPADGWIEIPKPPLTSVTSVKYRDGAGVLQTWAPANYLVEAPAGPRCRRGRISLAYGMTWPSTYGQAGDVTIRFVCGYSAMNPVPPLLKAAMLVDVAQFFVNRENPVCEWSARIYASFHSPATQCQGTR